MRRMVNAVDQGWSRCTPCCVLAVTPNATSIVGGLSGLPGGRQHRNADPHVPTSSPGHHKPRDTHGKCNNHDASGDSSACHPPRTHTLPLRPALSAVGDGREAPSRPGCPRHWGRGLFDIEDQEILAVVAEVELDPLPRDHRPLRSHHDDLPQRRSVARTTPGRPHVRVSAYPRASMPVGASRPGLMANASRLIGFTFNPRPRAGCGLLRLGRVDLATGLTRGLGLKSDLPEARGAAHPRKVHCCLRFLHDHGAGKGPAPIRDHDDLVRVDP